MWNLLLALAGLCLSPVFMMLLLKAADKSFSFAGGYVCGTILHITIFSLCTGSMAEKMEAPGLMPIKVMVAVIFAEAFAWVVVTAFRCVKAKKWIGVREALNLPELEKETSLLRINSILCLAAAFFLWLLGACSYLRYVPEGAVTMMADINRLDYFGVTNGDPMTMLGYYLKKLVGVSQADAVCLAIPLSFYTAFVALMWDLTNGLFGEQKEKRNFCFLAEGILVLAGDCLYTQPYLALHGLNQLDNLLLALCIPFVFVIGIKFLFGSGKPIMIHGKKVWMPAGWFSLLLCLIGPYLLDRRVFAITALSVMVFALLFAGRRYLPWLKS